MLEKKGYLKAKPYFWDRYMCPRKKRLYNINLIHACEKSGVIFCANLHTLILLTLFGVGLAFPVVGTAPFRYHLIWRYCVLYTGRQDVKLYRLVNLLDKASKPLFFLSCLRLNCPVVSLRNCNQAVYLQQLNIQRPFVFWFVFRWHIWLPRVEGVARLPV